MVRNYAATKTSIKETASERVLRQHAVKYRYNEVTGGFLLRDERRGCRDGLPGSIAGCGVDGGVVMDARATIAQFERRLAVGSVVDLGVNSAAAPRICGSSDDSVERLGTPKGLECGSNSRCCDSQSPYGIDEELIQIMSMLDPS